MVGYQGWFTCSGDGASLYNGYYHWIKDGYPTLSAESVRVDMWPDVSELTPAEECPTALTYPDGRPAPVYSTSNLTTVQRHFQWMQTYGIDGVFQQRFGSQLIYPEIRAFHNTLIDRVRYSAESSGRVWAVMYDVTGADERPTDLVALIEEDWRHLVDVQGVTESSTYLQHRGLPVVGLWGLGIAQLPGTAEEAQELLAFFQDNPDPRYRATVIGGVQTDWRTLGPRSRSDPAWVDYYCALDVISPWTVSSLTTDADVDTYYRETVIADMARAAECGADFMPVVYPGYAYHNADPAFTFNAVPRRGGRLYWRQVHNATALGATMLYTAMFDEVDEATAMFKLAATSADAPAGVQLVTLDLDGDCLPSDWYLRLAGEAGRVVRGEAPLSEVIPITPPPADPAVCRSLIKVRLRITTTSDWTTVGLAGARFSNIILDVVDPQAEAVVADREQNVLLLTQPLATAMAGNRVAATVDLIPEDPVNSDVALTIGRGSLGRTEVEVWVVNGLEEVRVDTLVWAGIVEGDNQVSFDVVLPLSDFAAP